MKPCLLSRSARAPAARVAGRSVAAQRAARPCRVEAARRQPVVGFTDVKVAEVAHANAEEFARILTTHNFKGLEEICTPDCMWWEDKLWQPRPEPVGEKIKTLSSMTRNVSLGFDLEVLTVNEAASDAFLFGKFHMAEESAYAVFRLTFNEEGKINGRFVFRPPSRLEAEAFLKHPKVLDYSDIFNIQPALAPRTEATAPVEDMEAAIGKWVMAWQKGEWETLDDICTPSCGAYDGVGIWGWKMPNRDRLEAQLAALFPDGVDPNVISIAVSPDTNVGFMQWDYTWLSEQSGWRGLSDGITVFEFDDDAKITSVVYFKNCGFSQRADVFKRNF